MYSMNTFAVTTMHHGDHDRAFHMKFPAAVGLSRIQRLRIEYQFEALERAPSSYRPSAWASFSALTFLKHLQIIITFASPAGKKAFENTWCTKVRYLNAMREIISAIPKEVEHVTWGLTEEQKETQDYEGSSYAGAALLRMIYRMYEGLKGVDTLFLYEHWDGELGLRPALGNGEREDGDGVLPRHIKFAD